LVVAGCDRTVVLRPDQLRQYQLEARVRLIKGRADKFENNLLRGTVTNESANRYRRVWLIFYYDREDAIVGRPWISVGDMSPSDKVRIEQNLDADARVRRAELREVRLIQ
jgi:hypothetical protein